MTIGYVVSMFPCWSETFILNELVSHQRAGLDVNVFSIKNCNEKIVQEDALLFILKTIGPYCFINPWLWLLHVYLLAKSPLVYSEVVYRLITLKTTDPIVKIKALIVFLKSPKFVMAAQTLKIEHLHAHFATYPALLAWIIGKFIKKPFTVTAHAHDIYVNQDLLPIICEDAAAIVTISEFNKNFIVHKIGVKYLEKIKVIHCGIDLNKFKYQPNKVRNSSNFSNLNILSIGRLSGIKGYKFLIEGLKLLKNDEIPFCCTIIGDGPLKQKLLRQVKDSDLDKEVHFLGSKKSNEIPAYFKDADVFILACCTDKIEGHDGIPVVFMEAMAYGVPVIGTSLSGIPELIKHGETGLCAIPENTVDIKEKIKYFITHPNLVVDMRQKARKLIEEEFDISLSGEKLRALFNHDQFVKRKEEPTLLPIG